MTDFDKAFDTLESEGTSLVQDEPIRDVLSAPTFEPSKRSFDSIFADKKFTETLSDAQNSPVRATMIDATKQDPNQWAEAAKLSKQTGIPTDMVHRNMGDVKAQQKFDQIDFAELGRTSPVTSSFLTDHTNASQAYDDTDTLAGIERNIKGKEWWEQLEEEQRQNSVDSSKSSLGQFLTTDIPNIAKSFGARALAGGEKSLAGIISAFQESATKHIPPGREEEFAAFSLVDPRTVNKLPQELYNEAQMVLDQINSEDPTVTKAGEVFTGAIDSLTQQTPGLLLGTLARNPALALTLMGTSTFGSVYAESRAQGISAEESFQNAAFQGTVEAGTELLPFVRFAAMIKPGKKFSKAAVDFLMAEFPGEAVATALQRSADVFFAETDPEKRVDEVKEYLTSREHWTQDQVDTFLQTAAQTVLMAGGAKIAQAGAERWATPVESASEKLAEDATAAEAKTNVEQEKIDDLARLATESKLQTRNPDAMREFVDQATTEDDNVYIPGKELQQYLQDNNIETDSFVTGMLGLKNQIAEAVALDGDVLIPTADFVAYIADTDHFEPLRPHMRLSADTFTPTEQAAVPEEQRQFVESLVAEAEQAAETFTEAQAIYDDVKAQLIDTGRVTEKVASISAQLIPAWATVKAQETGQSVQEIYQAAGFAVKGPFVEKQAELAERTAALEQTPVLTEGQQYTQEGQIVTETSEFRNWFGDSEVVDDQNEPLTVYHGTQESFDAFETGKNKLAKEPGLFFSPDPGVASLYTGFHEIFPADKIGNVMPVYLSIKNLKIVDFEGSKEGRPEAVKLAKEEGHDGILLKNHFDAGGVQDQYVVFEPTQIKSIFNEGAFDPTDPDILKQEAPTQSREELQSQLTSKFEGLKLNLMGTGNVVTLSKIIVPEEQRGTGIGSQVMQELVDWADANGKTLAASPSTDFGGTKSRVRALNKRFGFVDNKGRNKNFEISETMIREPQAVTAEPLRQEARGFFDPENNLIRLTESSDLSTFLHETAHFFLEMEKKLNPDGMVAINDWFKRNAGAVAAEAEKQSDEDITVTANQVNVWLDEGATGDAVVDDAIRRATHEQFARGFETYLMEGKAPSVELRDAFRAFARWLTDLYRRVRGQLNVKLDDQMRKVLDRMIATEEQIAAAEAADRYRPLFTDAAMAGMTQDEFEAYKKKAQGATDKANETLREKIFKELTRQTEAWWKDEKQERAATITEQLKAQPVYAAIERLKTKGGDIKVDRAMVKDLLGIEAIPPSLRNMTVTGGAGVTPDDAAAFLGFKSGHEMLNEILNARSIKELADQQAEAEMRVEHGDILNDGTIAQEAEEAAHNEERGRVILSELKQLSKGQRVPAIDRMTIKQLAKENIGRLPLNKIRPAKYRRAEIKSAVAARDAVTSGDRGLALQHKTQQAMNFYLWRAAVAAQERGALIERFTRRFSKKSVRTELAKAGNGYLDQIDGILNRFQFKGSVRGAQVDRQNIEAWAIQRAEDGDNIQMIKEVLAENFRMHYKEVPFDVLEGIHDSLKNLNHVARFANRIKKDEEVLEFNEVKKEWLDQLENLPDKFNASRTDVVSGGVVKKFNWAISQMTKIPMLASWLDGGKRVGLSHDLMIQPITDAVAEEQKIWNEVGTVVMDAIKNRSKKDMARHNRKIWIPEIDDHLLGHQILSVALNAGNRSNLEKMLKGEGWVPIDSAEAQITVENPQIQAVLAHMNENDWKLVELIWNQIDLLFPKMAEVHKATSGLTLPKVEAEKLQTPFGEVTGGYYPIKYDPFRSKRASDTQDKIDEQTRSMFADGGFLKPNADTGAKIERTQYFAPIRLSLDVVPNHIAEVIHYITHFNPVRQIHKLTNDPDISEAMIRKIGRDEYRQIKPWLNDIAKDGREAPSKTFFEEILAKLRFGTTLGMMGFKASTGIIQISGLSNTYAEVGARYANRGLRHVVGSPQSMRDAWKFASENSKIMSNRVNTMDREVRNAMKKLEGKRGLLAATQEVSMKHIALIQTYMVDLPTWFAAYYKEIDVAQAELDAEDFDSMDAYNKAVDKRAFKRADFTVENVQGSGLTKDLPSIMRSQGEATRMFTMFFTFFSSLWNLERDLVRGAKSKQYSPTTVAAKALFLFAVPVAFEMMMRGQLTDSGDDDDEAWERYLTGLALYPVQSVPFIRDVVNGVSGEYKFQLTPLAGIIESGLRGAPKMADALIGDEELTKSQVKGTSKLVGAWFGAPGVSQVWNTGEHLYEVVQEGEELTVRELLFGPNRER